MGKQVQRTLKPQAKTLEETAEASSPGLGPTVPSPDPQHNRLLGGTTRSSAQPPNTPPRAAQERPRRAGAIAYSAAGGGGPAAARTSRPLPAAGPAPGEAPFAPPRARARPQLPRPPSCGKCGSFRVPHPLGSAWQQLHGRTQVGPARGTWDPKLARAQTGPAPPAGLAWATSRRLPSRHGRGPTSPPVSLGQVVPGLMPGVVSAARAQVRRLDEPPAPLRLQHHLQLREGLAVPLPSLVV